MSLKSLVINKKRITFFTCYYHPTLNLRPLCINKTYHVGLPVLGLDPALIIQFYSVSIPDFQQKLYAY